MKSFLRGMWTVSVVLLMSLFGVIMCVFGYLVLGEWRSFRTALLACAVIWLIGGIVMLAAAVWVAASRGRSRLGSLFGGISTVASGAVLAFAAATHVLPCSGPD
jgi:hypothetical protein